MCILRSQFLYIVVLCQLWLVELDRFQYYLDCDCMFDLFNCTEVYSCEAQLLLSQLIPESCLQLIELYSLCHEVKDSSVNLLHSMPRDLLHLCHELEFILISILLAQYLLCLIFFWFVSVSNLWVIKILIYIRNFRCVFDK